jgi:hypothetical protein
MSHAKLSPSSAHRWMNCAGSLNMIDSLPEDQRNPTSAYAQEGTAAHRLAERALERGLATESYMSVYFKGVLVTEEMCEHVQVYVDAVREVAGSDDGSTMLLEHRFNLADFNPPGPMYGTSDAIVYTPLDLTLHVFDLKYGQGLVVEVEGNPQLQYYGLGALLEFERRMPHLRGKIKRVVLHIVQPRAEHSDGKHRTCEMEYFDLLAFGKNLLDLAALTQEPDAPLEAGSWCRFCPAKGVCPEKKEAAMAVARVEFEALPANVPPAPASLPVEVLGDILDNADILEDWLKGVRAHVMRLLENGHDVPGWKMVPKRASRKWVDEKETARYLAAEGFELDEITEVKTRSVAQIEKLMKKEGKKLPKDMFTKKSSGNTLAPDSDSRPAVVSDPAASFAAEPQADDNS